MSKTKKQRVILPCPICGYPPKVSKNNNIVSIRCDKKECKAMVAVSAKRMKKAVRRWNTRHAPQDTIDAIIMELFQNGARLVIEVEGKKLDGSGWNMDAVNSLLRRHLVGGAA